MDHGPPSPPPDLEFVRYQRSMAFAAHHTDLKTDIAMGITPLHTTGMSIRSAVHTSNGMSGIELDRIRKQREQRFSQPQSMMIEDTATTYGHQQKVFYVRGISYSTTSVQDANDEQNRTSLTDEEDPQFAMIIDLDLPDSRQTHEALIAVRPPLPLPSQNSHKLTKRY